MSREALGPWTHPIDSYIGGGPKSISRTLSGTAKSREYSPYYCCVAEGDDHNVPSRGKTTSGLNRDVQEIVFIFIVFSGNKSLRKCVTAPFDGFDVIMTNEGYPLRL